MPYGAASAKALRYALIRSGIRQKMLGFKYEILIILLDLKPIPSAGRI